MTNVYILSMCISEVHLCASSACVRVCVLGFSKSSALVYSCLHLSTCITVMTLWVQLTLVWSESGKLRAQWFISRTSPHSSCCNYIFFFHSCFSRFTCVSLSFPSLVLLKGVSPPLCASSPFYLCEKHSGSLFTPHGVFLDDMPVH